MVKIIPSVLTLDLKFLQEKLKQAEGIVQRVQIDIVDGQFAKNKTIDPVTLREFETPLLLDFHLMTKEPIDWVEKCFASGADRIIGQIELMSNQVQFVEKVQSVGVSVGLAIDIDTPVSKIDPTILTNLDVVLVMSVRAGFDGQKFEIKALEKIKKLDEIRFNDKTPYRICDDGGITFNYLKEIKAEGVDEVVIGKRIFEGDLEENIKRLQMP